MRTLIFSLGLAGAVAATAQPTTKPSQWSRRERRDRDVMRLSRMMKPGFTAVFQA